MTRTFSHSRPGLRLAICACVLGLMQPACAQPSLINFQHLRDLTESIRLNGDTVDIVHVYSNYPDYRWFDAADAGVEGTACVDDAARAAVLYLRHFEVQKDPASLEHARSLLKFVLAMQDTDGQFYNFVYRDHSINRTGRTSIKSFGWWAARAVWAIGTGYRVFTAADTMFAERLQRALVRALPYVDRILQRYGTTAEISGYRVPRWLLYDSGADGTSELCLGLEAFAAAKHDSLIDGMIRRLADGIMIMQDGSPSTYPFGLHRSWETQWHMWGNGQTQFLATAGKRLHDRAMVASSEREADGFFSRLLIDGFLKECDLARKGSRVQFEQISYAVRPMAVGLLRLYEATGQRRYLVMAGLSGSWFLGNNVAGMPMYDRTTGRCYDGIRDSSTVNKNSGAESTIEALSTLSELESSNGGAKYLSYAKVKSNHTKNWNAALFQSPTGGEVTVAIRMGDGRLEVLEDQESKAFWERLP